MENNGQIKLEKVYLEFKDAESGLIMQYQQENTEGDGLQSVELPFDPDKFTPGHIRMDLYHKDEKNPIPVEGLSKLQYIILGEDGNVTADMQDWKRGNRILEAIQPNYFEPAQGKIFPSIRYYDVTERDMFGEEPIDSSTLSGDNGGIWAWHGLRKFEIEIKDLDVDEDVSDLKQRVSLYWYKRDNDTIQPIFEREIRYNVKERKYIAYINTNALGDALEHAESKHPTFYGRFEVHLSWQRYKKVYSFPINICVNNTKPDGNANNHLIHGNKMVSIDFGTSSTCAAIQGRRRDELITLSGKEKRDITDKDSPFENPTNLMIYTWSEFYNQWQKDNKDCPFLVAKSDRLDDIQADYDSGYTVDDVLKEVVGGEEGDIKGRLKMLSILTQIKMVPTLLRNNFEIKLHPLNDIDNPVVIVTDKVEEEDYYHFNPIAFYGYLLSRAINNPAKGTCYTDYLVSFPVKFAQSERESILKSLEYGILRGLPYYVANATTKRGNPLVKVSMLYEESVACIGAIVGKQLQISEESPEPKLFSIFDLGGGTLDISYGMFRNSTEEEQIEEGSDQTIQIFGVSGDDMVGGEKLIHQIAYKIYRDNRETIEENEIVFELPLGELNPEGFDGLLKKTSDEISAANLSTMKENVARKIFVYDGDEAVEDVLTRVLGPDISPSAGMCRITLRNKHNEAVELELKIEGIEDFLEDKVKKMLENFKVELRETFSKEINREAMQKAGLEDFSLDDVAIFLGGNASKQHFIKENLNALFPNNKIAYIGEGQNPEGVSEKFKITGKTAVAFGQLSLDNYYVDRPFEEDASPFPYHVGYIKTGSNTFERVIAKGDVGNDWKPANFIGRTGTISLSYTDNPQNEHLIKINEPAEIEDPKKKKVWIRIAQGYHNSIEYRLCGTKEPAPSADDPVDETCLIELKDRSTVED